MERLQKYVRIHLAAGRIVTRMSMSLLEGALPPEQFFRIHRSYIVNFEKIESIEGNVVHVGKHDLPVSKGRREAFMEMARRKGLGGIYTL